MGRRLVVSDIHGEGHRLACVLEKAKYDPRNDRLFLLGDYIDRGQDSKFTIELVRKLVQEGAIALKGNHERMLEKSVSSIVHRVFWWSIGGWKTCKDFGWRLPPADVVEFVASLPVIHEEDDAILVHGGLLPHRPIHDQKEDRILWIRGKFHRKYRGKLVVFGHTPTWFLHGAWKPWFGKDKIGIDTGAVFGGFLTLFDLDTHEVWTA